LPNTQRKLRKKMAAQKPPMKTKHPLDVSWPMWPFISAMFWPSILVVTK
jgi:hypothetical protein